MGDNSATIGNAIKCPHCGLFHDATCPRIKAIDYHESGAVKRVEFHNYAPFPNLIPDPLMPPWKIT